MRRKSHVRFREGVGVQFPRATRPRPRSFDDYFRGRGSEVNDSTGRDRREDQTRRITPRIPERQAHWIS